MCQRPCRCLLLVCIGWDVRGFDACDPTRQEDGHGLDPSRGDCLALEWFSVELRVRLGIGCHGLLGQCSRQWSPDRGNRWMPGCGLVIELFSFRVRQQEQHFPERCRWPRQCPPYGNANDYGGRSTSPRHGPSNSLNALRTARNRRMHRIR